MDSPALPPFWLNGCKADLQRGQVTDAAGHITALRPQAAEVLKVLAAAPGKLVSKEELMAAVWGNIAVTDDSLVQCITEIRKALGDDRHEIVRTLPKRGYVLEAGGAEAAAGAASAARPSRRWIGFAAGLAGLIALGAAYFWPTGGTEAEPPAIAVLPFDNLSEDAKWNRFATGITEDIISDLARFRDIPVIARTSTEVYRGKPHDVREVGKALNAKYVLEGSLQVDGFRMRVTAQLIDAESGKHVWSERYDRPAAELLDVQDEITQKIAATVTGWQGQLTEAERALARRKNATDLDAYDYWLLGIEAKHRMTPEGAVEARAYFEKGLKIAPDFMPLLRDLAYTYSIEWEIGSYGDFSSSLKLRDGYAMAAYALDPNDANANYAMSAVQLASGNLEKATHYEERARQLAPNNSDVSMLLAWSWADWELERAIELMERTLKISPHYPVWWNFPVMQNYFAARRFEEAEAAARRLGESPNQAAFLAMSAAQLGKTAAAKTAAAKVLSMKPDWTAESMSPYQKFKNETLLPESAAKAGLPVCMTPEQLAKFTGVYRFAKCDEERARAARLH